MNLKSIKPDEILKMLAETSGFNIIVTEEVKKMEPITLSLNDIPWDQALDIIMRSKGLDMRRNGKVLWIAPKDELLTKEKLDLDQLKQIAELEPLKTESFQLNYQKAESFKSVFGTDGSSTNRLLSARGSAMADPRTNQLFITDIASKLEEVRKLIQKTDIPTRQV